MTSSPACASWKIKTGNLSQLTVIHSCLPRTPCGHNGQHPAL